MSGKETWTERELIPQVTQALQQIAADNAAIKAEVQALIQHQVSTTGAAVNTVSATSNTFLTSWDVPVSQGATASSPAIVLNQTMSQTAGGVLITNPTSQALTVLFYRTAVPGSPSVANAQEVLEVRPYSWQSKPTLPWVGVVVRTFGTVVSTATTAIIGAYTTIPTGYGPMQEDITSSTSKYWTDTALQIGDSLSLTSPWGGHVDLDMISMTGGSPVTTLKIGNGFSGTVSGTIGGGSLRLGENFSGQLTLQSTKNIVLEAGRNNRFDLTLGQASYDSSFSFGDGLSGTGLWQAQQSTLHWGDNGQLSGMKVGLYSGSSYDISIDVGHNSAPPLALAATAAQLYGIHLTVGDNVSSSITLISASTTQSVYAIDITLGDNSHIPISVTYGISASNSTLAIGANAGFLGYLWLDGSNNSLSLGDGAAPSIYLQDNTNVVLPPSTTNGSPFLAGIPPTSGAKRPTGTLEPGNRPIWYSATSTTTTGSFTSATLFVGDCPQLNFLSPVSAVTGTLTWKLQTQTPAGAWVTRQSFTATSATTVDASFGPGLQYNDALGQYVRLEASVSGTNATATFNYSLVGTGGNLSL